MKFLISVCLSLLLLIAPLSANAAIAVIVHPSNSAALDNNTISRVFLGKLKSFPGGGQAVPVNLAESDPTTTAFNKSVLKKSGSQLKAYWSKLVFTGKGTPPKVIDSSAEMIKLVGSNPNLIGYVDASQVDGSVKVIATF